MKAIVLKRFGGVENLVLADVPMPVFHENEVLVHVKAISINPVDIKTRSGKALAARLQTEQPIILGWDVSGVVVGRGSEVSEFNVGDEVFGMVNFPGHGKAYAEYVAIPASQIARKPANISHEEAAAATLAPLTVWQAMHQRAADNPGENKPIIQPNDRVLVHGASGGVGHYAVQIAKHLGAYVIGTSSAANRDFVLGIGADEHIDYTAHRFEDVATHIDFVLDIMGGDYIDRSLEVMQPGGTIVSLPSAFNQAVGEKAQAKGMHGHAIMVKSNGQDMKALADLLERGIVKSHVSRVFQFTEMADAHLQIESGRTVGKVVVVI